MKHIATFLMVSLLVQSLHAQGGEPTKLDPSQPYQGEKRNAVQYEADFSIIVTAPHKTKVLKVWLPIPPSDAVQTVTTTSLSSFPQQVEPKIGSEPVFGNRFAYFEFSQPQGAQIIRHQFKLQTHEVNWSIDPAHVVPVKEWPASFNPFRRSEAQAVVVDDRFAKLLQKIVPQRKDSLSDIALVMTWVEENFTYDHHDASLAADSARALEKRRGHCSDYHGFCAAMGRALGYPTRVTYGMNTFPKNSPSHCKLEAFLPPYGWVSFDVSETQKLVTALKKDEKLATEEKGKLIAAAQRRLFSGFRDNTWFLHTVGTDYDLQPPTSHRVAVVRTAYIEADGIPLPDPDPADPEKREFAWMTALEFKADQKLINPFADYSSLRQAE